jgi:hypothetical protein
MEKMTLKSEINRMQFLMEYSSYNNEKHKLYEEEVSVENPDEKKDGIPFRVNRVGGNKLKIQSKDTGNSIEIPFDSIEKFIEKISTFKKI